MVAREQVQAITFEEFLVLYEGRHAEWHPDGTVEEIMGVGLTHIRVVELLIVLFSFYKRLHPEVRVVFAPYPIRIAGLPAREPDLLILVGENAERLTENYSDGAPDIAVEVVSPESRLRDYQRKIQDYHKAGIREYWIIDPAWKKVDVLEWGAEGYTPRPTVSEGKFSSGVLSDFVLDPAVLWVEDSPDPFLLMRLVETMSGKRFAGDGG